MMLHARLQEAERLTMLDIKITKTTCPVCGKDVERTSGAVKYCSEKCRNEGNQMQYELRKKLKSESYIPSQVMCKICGKPVLPERGTLRRYARKQIHEECVVNDVINTVLNGERISSCQRTRLLSRGIDIEDVYEEIKRREENENEELQLHVHN